MHLLLTNEPELGEVLSHKWTGGEVVEYMPENWLEKYSTFLIPDWFEVEGNTYQVVDIWKTFLGSQGRRKKLLVYGTNSGKFSNYISVAADTQEFQAKCQNALKMANAHQGDSENGNIYPATFIDPDLLTAISASVLTHKSNNFFDHLNTLRRSLEMLPSFSDEVQTEEESRAEQLIRQCDDLVRRLSHLWQKSEPLFRWMPDYQQLLDIPDLIEHLENSRPDKYHTENDLAEVIKNCLGGGIRQLRRIYDLEPIIESS